MDKRYQIKHFKRKYVQLSFGLLNNAKFCLKLNRFSSKLVKNISCDTSRHNFGMFLLTFKARYGNRVCYMKWLIYRYGNSWSQPGILKQNQKVYFVIIHRFGSMHFAVQKQNNKDKKESCDQFSTRTLRGSEIPGLYGAKLDNFFELFSNVNRTERSALMEKDGSEFRFRTQMRIYRGSSSILG